MSNAVASSVIQLPATVGDVTDNVPEVCEGFSEEVMPPLETLIEYLVSVVPASEKLRKRLKLESFSFEGSVRRFIAYQDKYGKEDFSMAVEEALKSGKLSPSDLLFYLIHVSQKVA